MTLDVEIARRSVVKQIKALGKPGGVPELQAYLGSPYPVLGLSTPQMRTIMQAFAKSHRHLTASEVNALAAALWSGQTHEEKSFAISLLNRYKKTLNDSTWKLTNRWVNEAVGWGLCDSLGAGPISTMVYRRPTRFREVLTWTRATNFWRRRVAAYAMRDFAFAGGLDKPFTLLKRLLYDKEFWIQRAVGTWLRECWKKDRRRTEAFLRRHVRGLPPVVITVATERASKLFREELRRKRKN